MAASVSLLRDLLGVNALMFPLNGEEPNSINKILDFYGAIKSIQNSIKKGLHLFETTSAKDRGNCSGFLCSSLSAANIKSNILWISERRSGEGGSLYGPGLNDVGLDPSSVLLVETQSSSDVLWAAEEGLRSKAIGAVVAEISSSARALDLTASRRLALRSERSGVPAYLLATGEGLGATAARTRWRVTGAPSRLAPGPSLLGYPAWTVELLKNRDGPCGRQVLGFAPELRRFFPIGDSHDATNRRGSRFKAPLHDRTNLAEPLIVRLNTTRRRVDEADRR